MKVTSESHPDARKAIGIAAILMMGLREDMDENRGAPISLTDALAVLAVVQNYAADAAVLLKEGRPQTDGRAARAMEDSK